MMQPIERRPLALVLLGVSHLYPQKLILKLPKLLDPGWCKMQMIGSAFMGAPLFATLQALIHGVSQQKISAQVFFWKIAPKLLAVSFTNQKCRQGWSIDVCCGLVACSKTTEQITVRVPQVVLKLMGFFIGNIPTTDGQTMTNCCLIY